MSKYDELREEFRTLLERVNDIYESLECFRDRLVAAIAEDEEPDEWVRLPEDKNGEIIHIGDRMACGAHSLGKVWAIAGDVVMFEHSFDHGYSQVECFDAEVLTHDTPDDWDRIISDAMIYGIDSYLHERVGNMNKIPELVKRCEKLAEEVRDEHEV